MSDVWIACHTCGQNILKREADWCVHCAKLYCPACMERPDHRGHLESMERLQFERAVLLGQMEAPYNPPIEATIQQAAERKRKQKKASREAANG